MLNVSSSKIMILGVKVVQNLPLEKKCFTEKVSKIDILKWKKQTNKNKFCPFLKQRNRQIYSYFLPLRMLILGQKSCYLGPPIIEIPKTEIIPKPNHFKKQCSS